MMTLNMTENYSLNIGKASQVDGPRTLAKSYMMYKIGKASLLNLNLNKI